MKRSRTKSSSRTVAMAIAAHPDDIEFNMAGTLLLLKERGWEIHYLNLSSGNCGSNSMTASQTRKVRRAEAMSAAALLGAQFHLGFCNDLEIFYELKALRHLASIIRDVAPSIVLTHSPEDYMEDHMNTSRLAVSAAFARGMPNFECIPPRKPIEGDVAIYHAMPHGLQDPLRRIVQPELYVDVSDVHPQKRLALAEHRSQKEWLDASQGMDSYLLAMDQFSRELGIRSRKFHFAEGWRRHLHIGFSADDSDPLREALNDCILINKNYLKQLATPAI